MTLEEWSQVGEIVSAVATALIVATTFFANKHIKELSEYSNKQGDRKIIEDIYFIQSEAEREFGKDLEFKDLKTMMKLTKAREISKLYGLHHIELHLQKIIDAYGEGHVVQSRILDRNGNWLSNHKAEDMDRFHQLQQNVTEYFSDIACYKNYLTVNAE